MPANLLAMSSAVLPKVAVDTAVGAADTIVPVITATATRGVETTCGCALIGFGGIRINLAKTSNRRVRELLCFVSRLEDQHKRLRNRNLFAI
mmetsp:Transcript_15288/g.32862  ORF Transcript_15288/g.32862 Transcript_15288/m.32862 type:complete len:92 (+) Transcript_15288:306-581(+)